MPRLLWVYWEMPPGMRALPPHIELCRRIMQRKAIGYELRVVGPDNLADYLPDLPDRLLKIALNPQTRWEKYFGRRARRIAAIALRVDYIRAFLLEKYGGLYIDSDAIVLGDLTPYFESLERVGFVVTRRSSHGKSHASVNFYGSVASGTVIREYAAALRQRLAGSLEYDWNEVGAEMLTPIVDRHTDNVLTIAEREVQPITFEDADQKFSSTLLEPEDVLTESTRIFMLYSGPFKRSLAGLDQNELCHGNRLISKMFRRALADRSLNDIQGQRRSPAPVRSAV